MVYLKHINLIKRNIMHKFTELKIWNKAMDLTTEVYKTTAKFPTEEKYGLISQMRRCAVSIPSNIAEGAGRNTNGEFRQFLGYANGSSFELQTQLILSNRLQLIDDVSIIPLLREVDELQKMNYKLQESKR